MNPKQSGIKAYLRNHRLLSPLQGQGLKALALKGSVWTIGGFGIEKIIQLGSNLILTRILFPEAFGIMALANICVIGLGMFSDVGTRGAIIQNERGEEPVFLNTAWTIQICRGFFLWACACLLAYPVAAIYGQPQLLPLLMVIGSAAAIDGFQSTAMATANRKMQFGRLAIIQLVCQIVTIAALVILAWIFQSVWALAVGGVIGSLTRATLSHLYLPSHRHKLGIERNSFNDIFKFGRWIFLATMITFVGGQGILAIQGTLVSVDTFAFIYLAGMFATLVSGLIQQLLHSIAFPALSKVARDDPRRLPVVLAKIRNFVFIASLPAFIFLSLVSTSLIDFLYDDRYAIAGSYLSILAINGAIEVLPAIYQHAFLAQGNSRVHFILMSVIMLFRITGLFFGFYIANIEGMLIGIGVGSLVSYFVIAYFAYKAGWILWKGDFVAISVILMGAYLSFG